jgi:RsiW-degrading membrane proteinase PrsW (M82 family)
VGRQSGGKRKGARKAARPPRRFRRDVFLLTLATTVAVVAWGYLVRAAVDFTSDARGGQGQAWAFVVIAAVGAAACLFAAMMLLARVVRALGTPPVSSGSAGSDRPTDSHPTAR